jgi:hypothetical protein
MLAIDLERRRVDDPELKSALTDQRRWIWRKLWNSFDAAEAKLFETFGIREPLNADIEKTLECFKRMEAGLPKSYK